MSKVMLSFGSFKFSISSASYSELTKTWNWKWSSQPVIGHSDQLQCTGKEPVSVSISGEVSPLFNSVGVNQIEALARLGDEMKPHLLVSGLGDILGYWCMTSVTETNTKFVSGGLPRLQTFTAELKFYGDNI